MTAPHTYETRIDEIGDGIYRISTPIPPQAIAGGFTFNQFLIDDDAPLLFHTGPRKLFDRTRDAIARVMPVENLRYVAYSHFEPDECGALNEFLSSAPQAEPVCGRISAMVCAGDYADRKAMALADGQRLDLGSRVMEWIDAPHVPHGWDCGFLADISNRTLFCGDLFTQNGANHAPLTKDDILEPSEASRRGMDYFAYAPRTTAVLERMAALQPTTLACMHGASWQGDGAGLLRALAARLADGGT